MSVFFALGAGIIFLLISKSGLSPWWFLGAAVMIQARLLCNMMDGMVAIEGGRKSVTGDLFNEVPDRIADVIILAGLGLNTWQVPWGIHLGWLAAALAVFTACVRMQGAGLTGRHEFCGPMAKPQRMALATGACAIKAVFPAGFDWVFWALTIMIAGEIITLWRRLSRISKSLKEKP
ncbi:MAG: CDP-alcohol phosphatidyltransferase family protein [Armatimonadetes bacterium]|nr:CDP-alcohol phosphatidyltransferase family protein [Akkermansiaceae bacterium]